MMRIEDRTRNLILYGGILLLIAGFALFYLALQRFETLPNHLRLASLIPLTSAMVMLRVDVYRDWSAATWSAKGGAIGALIAPPMLVIGVMAWWLTAPDAIG
jgi:hypothetical protein